MVSIPQKFAHKLMPQIVEHIADWPIRSAEQFRNAILGDGALAINPLLDITEDRDVDTLRDMLAMTVAEGRMIDFGHIPNEVIKAESIRSRRMFEAGEFVQPYQNWLAVTSWEGGFNGYYISTIKKTVHVIELYGVSVPNVTDVILVYDMVSIHMGGVGDTRVLPAVMRELVPGQPAIDPSGRGANSLDPLVTVLRLLADASIPVTVKESPDKLNKARAKQGKFPIPRHTVVATHDYVASYHATTGGHRVAKGGTHASPVAHWRRAHERHLADGRVIPVKSSKVNWRSDEEMHRLFYRIKK